MLATSAGACGGSDDSGDADAQPTENTAPTTGDGTGGTDARAVEADVPESLEFLGGIPAGEEAYVVAFEEQPGDFTFGDGTRVEVPAGAFAGPTDVMAVRVTLDFDQYDPALSDGAAYVLSTEDDVDLAEPIHLELATEGTVLQLRDGNWEALDGTRIPIEHFSEVPTVVVPPQTDAALVEGDAPDGNTDAEFLVVCINVLGPAMVDEQGARSLGIQLAFQMCTRALIERYEPGDTYVSTACVAEKIDGPNLRAAVDQCAAEARASESDEDDGGEAADPPPPEPEEPAASPPAETDAVVGFTGGLESEGATLDVEWSVPVSDGSGSGTGVVVLNGPCTAGVDGEPGGEVIEADIAATIGFDADVTISDDTLTLTTSGFTITGYTGQDEACRSAFDQGLGALGPLVDGSAGAEPGSVLIGSFEGTLTIE